MDLKQYIREIPDWPKKGVNFKDITPLLENAEAFKFAVDELAKPYLGKKVDLIVGIDARGFIFASALAYKLGAGLAIVRKKGKLPGKTINHDYTLEYASSAIEMREDAIKPDQSVVIVDDLLATGGTMEAAIKLVEQLGGKIEGISFLIDLKFLKGKEKLKNYPIYSLISYES
ncbi:MAG TPA: adenine phosphoribosyltransferase [Candidatus Paceibacterota bacterium]